MKKAIFVTVRTGSSRLLKKALIEINGKRAIEHLIGRLKASKKADMIVLCTTTLEEDGVLCDIAKKNGINFYRGSVADKLERWNGAAQKYGVEFFITADGDDLFCDPELIDLAFRQYEKDKSDFIEGKDLICGSFTYGIKASALGKVCEIKNTEDTEMMWVYFKDTGLFKTAILENVPSIFCRPEIRMTLDYPDDLKFFKTIIEHFDREKKDAFTLRDIISYLDKSPEVIKINQYLQEKFLANQKAKTKLMLKDEAMRDGKNA
jgi:spore coat polysaccharide biosynthesis protein SpsF